MRCVVCLASLCVATLCVASVPSIEFVESGVWVRLVKARDRDQNVNVMMGQFFRIGFCTVHEHGSPLGGMRIIKAALRRQKTSIAKPNSARSLCRPSPCAGLAPNLVLNLRRSSPCVDLAPNLVLNLRRPSPCAGLAPNPALNLRTQI